MAAMPPHQALSDHYTTFSSDLYHHSFLSPAAGEAPGGGCELETYPLPFFDHNHNYISGGDGGGAILDHHIGLPESDVLPQVPMMSSPFLSGRQHNNLGVIMDMAVPVLQADQHFNINGLCGGFGYQTTGAGAGGGLCEFVEDYCGFGTDHFKSISPSSEDNWGNQCNQTPAIEESNIKVGRYSAEERKDRILRYLKKRNQRNFNKTIKYACRKTLADRRIRVRGRFARNNELSEEETIMKKINDTSDHKDSELLCGDAIQMKHDDEDWLQEAMASLIYLPYV